MEKKTPQIKTLQLSLKKRIFSIEYFYREGSKDTLLFIHGLGGAKENFWESCKSNVLAEHSLICFDNPGTGNSTYYDDLILEIDDLVKITTQFINQLGLRNFILVGASMGGLTTMLYLKRGGLKNVKAYVNIEGNLMPEDCLFSSKVITHDYEHFSKIVFPTIISDMKNKGNAGYRIIANNLELNTNVKSYYHYSFQTVRYSDTGELLKQYLSLHIPRIFIYGDENRQLSYIPDLDKAGMNIKMISNSNHFVFYDNPKEMYDIIGDFIDSLNIALLKPRVC